MDNKGDFTLWLKIFQTQNEAQKRWFAAQKAIELGYGGITTVRGLTGMSRTTITEGIREIKESKSLKVNRIRNIGGGRKGITYKGEEVVHELESILDENTSGDPMSSLKWTCKSTRKIADELCSKGFITSHQTVKNLLKKLRYSLQANKKTICQCRSPDRDGQFRHINDAVKEFIKSNDPVISVDAKKKELIGNFKNNGITWRKKGNYKKVNDHDFLSNAKGIAIPYGAYDYQRNEGFVNVGMTSDTAEFAGNSIMQWWKMLGSKYYSTSKRILICADGGGSNGSRNRAWKFNLYKFANATGLHVTVCHYPPGTSKWNKIEHRMFSFISLNWKGVPLESYETIIELISGTKTKKGLKIKAKLDERDYKKGIKISDDVFSQINIHYHKKYPKWNYTICPTK